MASDTSPVSSGSNANPIGNSVGNQNGISVGNPVPQLSTVQITQPNPEVHNPVPGKKLIKFDPLLRPLTPLELTFWFVLAFKRFPASRAPFWYIYLPILKNVIWPLLASLTCQESNFMSFKWGLIIPYNKIFNFMGLLPVLQLIVIWPLFGPLASNRVVQLQIWYHQTTFQAQITLENHLSRKNIAFFENRP